MLAFQESSKKYSLGKYLSWVLNIEHKSEEGRNKLFKQRLNDVNWHNGGILSSSIW